MAGKPITSAVAIAATDYLAVRRALGYKLEQSARDLRSFVTHFDASGAATVTVASAIEWAVASLRAATELNG